MSDTITEYSDYDAFAREWEGDGDETRMVWQLLGLLDDDELLIEIPEWLADEKTGFVDGATPTMFVGRIDSETDKAIQFTDSASARSLLKLAHRIDHLESRSTDNDQDEWLEDRLQDLRSRFERREDTTELRDEWIPKSQLLHAVRRC